MADLRIISIKLSTSYLQESKQQKQGLKIVKDLVRVNGVKGKKNKVKYILIVTDI